ncbi:hypothetical protein [Bacillus paramycoides]|uniref:hypothetical protein n=1 Tax=Bacillus paramycoides TaxID=2026194 RepID=UPI002E245ED7|nr:hypothetical protein [Bacillus paramycoides]
MILEIDNNTDQKLVKLDENLSEGGWAATPKAEIPPNSVLVFGAKSTSITEGTKGTITYTGDGI